MAKFSQTLTTANCTQPVEWQLREYIAWLSQHPERRAYVFPASKSGKRAGDLVRTQLRRFSPVTIDPADYLPGLPVDEGAVTATTSETKIAEWFDPTGALRKAGLLEVHVIAG